MVKQLLYTALLVASSVLIHATVLTWLFRQTLRWPGLAEIGFWGSTWRMVRVAWWIILAHVLEIAVWALFYDRNDAFADMSLAAYFSIVTYTTVGYGDVLPPERWRLLAGVEAMTGILMSGWSAAFFFSIANSRYSRAADPGEKPGA